MEKCLKLLTVLSCVCILASCDSSTTSASSSTSDSTSNTSTSNSTSLPVSALSEWSAEDKANIKKAFNDNESIDIPVPTGFTTSYVNASQELDGDYCFYVYDSECGDITDSYETQLIAADYSFYFDEDGVLGYAKFVENSLEAYIVQFGYNEDFEEFEIFAWYSADGGQYITSSYPYDKINDFFTLNVNNTTLPSFEVVSGGTYQSAPYDNKFLVSGFISSTSYLSTYSSALEAAGYVVEEDEGSYYALNSTVGLSIVFYSLENDDGTVYLDSIISAYVAPTEGDNNVSLTAADFSSSYPTAEETLTKEGVTYSYNYIMNANYIQFKKGVSYLQNDTAFTSLKSIVITKDSGTDDQYYGVLSLYVGNSKYDLTTKITPVATEGVYTYNVEGDYQYFILRDEVGFASKNSSIVISYNI